MVLPPRNWLLISGTGGVLLGRTAGATSVYDTGNSTTDFVLAVVCEIFTHPRELPGISVVVC